MTPRTRAQAALAALLSAVVPLLPYQTQWGTRRQLFRYGTRGARVRMEGEEVIFAAMRAWGMIEQLPEYAEFVAACAADERLRHGPGAAGRWCSPEWILKRVLECAVRLRTDGHRTDVAAARRELDRFARFAVADQLRFRASARILGLRPSKKAIGLPFGFTLRRLSQSDINQREKAHSSLRTFYEPFADDILRIGLAELSFDLSVAVPRDSDRLSPVQDAWHAAEEEARVRATAFVDALHLTVPGFFQYDGLELHGDYREGVMSRPVRDGPPPFSLKRLVSRDERRLRTALAVALGSEVVDRAMTQAAHRFLLATRRRDPIDAMVDLVIGWESLLLTSAGNPVQQELSYRFALHGSHVLRALGLEADPLVAFGRLKAAYSIRSLLVHGAVPSAVQKTLKSSGFDSEYELIDYLRTGLREALLRFAETPKNQRPYIAKQGWELALLAPRRTRG